MQKYRVGPVLFTLEIFYFNISIIKVHTMCILCAYYLLLPQLHHQGAYYVHALFCFNIPIIKVHTMCPSCSHGAPHSRGLPLRTG